MTDASTMQTPWRRDPEELTPRLQRWAEHRFGPGATVSGLSAPEGTGMSSETVLFDLSIDATSTRCVARLAPLPSDYPVFADYDLRLQQRCMELVGAHTDVAVPTVLHLEDDLEWLGTEFMVMGRIDGVAPADMPPYVFGGWLVDLAAEARAELQANAVAVLAGVHQITPEDHDLSVLPGSAPGATALAAQLSSQRRYYDWARESDSYPLIDATLAWLEANLPAETTAVLNWGDSRIGNMLFRGVQVVGVLDWEMAAVGPPEVDLAWFAFLHRFFQDMAERYGFPGLPDFLRVSDVVAEYQRLTGRTVGDLRWFTLFAALRFAIVSVRTSKRSIAFGSLAQPENPDDLIMFKDLLAQMLDGSYRY